jgi:O-Antigen ligase
MVSVRPATSARLLHAGFGIVGIGVFVALATDVAVSVLTPAKLAFVLGGFALVIPTMVVEDPKAYWLFLLVLSIPFDIAKLLSGWLVDPQTLVDLYGESASGTNAVELYLTDVVLIAMLLPWLAQVCMRRQSLYFPKIGYLFVFYLAWALLVSLINAESFYLAIFELCRQAVYFLSFVYLINNVATRLQFRSAVWAVFLGLIISASTVIIFFELDIRESAVFARLADRAVTSSQGQAYKPGAKAQAGESLTLHDTGRRFGPANRGQGSDIKRSQGMFRHPAIPAGLCGLTLPIVLAYLITARTNRDRILFFMVFVLGITALALTFSRAGAIGFVVGTLVFFAVGGWSGLISRRGRIRGIVVLATAAVVSIPLLLVFFGARPGTFVMRFYMFEAALDGYSQHPILGVGLNNSTAAMKEGRQELRDLGIPTPPTEPADSYYLAILTEVGPLGLILFFGFFGKIVMIGLRAMSEVATDLKPLLVGIVAGLTSLATQSLGDGPLAGHAVGGLLWLFAGLIIAIARDIQAAPLPSSVGGHPRLPGPRSH